MHTKRQRNETRDENNGEAEELSVEMDDLRVLSHSFLRITTVELKNRRDKLVLEARDLVSVLDEL